jgi:hypothetical protein
MGFYPIAYIGNDEYRHRYPYNQCYNECYGDAQYNTEHDGSLGAAATLARWTNVLERQVIVVNVIIERSEERDAIFVGHLDVVGWL